MTRTTTQNFDAMARDSGLRMSTSGSASREGMILLADAAMNRLDRFYEPRATAVTPEGLVFTVRWAPAARATAAVIDDAHRGRLHLRASVVGEPAEGLTATEDGDHLKIANSAGLRLRSLWLDGLCRRGTDESLDSQEALSGLGLRLVISAKEGPDGGWVPLFACPPVPARGALPALFTGADYRHRWVELPRTIDGPVRVSLARSGFPDDTALDPAGVDTVSGWQDVLAEDLTLAGPDSAVLWAQPGAFVPPAAGEADLKTPAELALNAAVQAGEPTEVAFRLTSAEPAAVFATFTPPRGALLRVESGTLRTAVAGEPARVALTEPLDPPATAHAEVAVRYNGLRLLEELSDPLPPTGAASGQVVGAAPVLRRFPPRGLDGWDVARVGLLGRAPEACTLQVQWVDATGSQAGPPVAPPATLTVEPSLTLVYWWFDLPPRERTTGPVALAVRATQGRFFWWQPTTVVEPGVRVVVRDLDPPARPLTVNGAVWLTVDGDGLTRRPLDLPPSLFAAGPPVLDCPLFLTVDFVDLTLRYPR